MNWIVFLICLLIYITHGQTEVKIDVKSQTQTRLDLALKNLVKELEDFGTRKQNPLNLQIRMDETCKCLAIMKEELSQYNSVILGEGNTVSGDKNIIVGNYNSISGSQNFVFIDGFKGQANSSLIIVRWKIQLDKKQLIRINPSFAITLLTDEENKKYQKYLKKNKNEGKGNAFGKNTVSIFKDIKEQINNQILKGFTNITRPESSIIGQRYLASSNAPFATLPGDKPTEQNLTTLNGFNNNLANLISILPVSQLPLPVDPNIFPLTGMDNKNPSLNFSPTLINVPNLNLPSFPNLQSNHFGTDPNLLNINNIFKPNMMDPQINKFNSVILESKTPPVDMVKSTLLETQKSPTNLKTPTNSIIQPFNPFNLQLRTDLGTKYLRTNQISPPTSNSILPAFETNTAFNMFLNSFPAMRLLQ